MAVVGSVHGGSLPSKFPARIFNTQKRSIHHRRPPPPPIFISTNLSDVNPIHLRDLYSSCNHSCHRFPNIYPDGRVEPVDITKLRLALSHSSVVVSVFARPEHATSLPENSNTEGDWYRRMVPLTPFNGQLVGFGRAVSDSGFTASIYDVTVIPSLQCRGIGRLILQRIIRLLTNKGIYDIAALCSDKEMDFFKACGFGDDILGSTTMMYTRTGTHMVKSAVGWIDPNNKYCTKIDASGNANPVWKTKFAALIDNSDSRFDDLALNVEVFSRDPVFLKERIQGTASVVLKEFLDKHVKSSKELKHVEEVGSFQLRKRNSNKPQGFVDVSIKISEEKDEGGSYHGDDAGIKLKIRNNDTTLPPPTRHSKNYFETNDSTLTNYSVERPNYPSTGPTHQTPYATPLPLGPSYHHPQTPPPPPYNVGHTPTFFSKTDNLTPSYINMPSSSSSGVAPGPRNGPGFAMGLGAGALAAGAVIFGDDFISGFDLPTHLQDTGFTISTDPPF